MSDTLMERVKKACLRFKRNYLLGYEFRGCMMHPLALEFNEIESPLVSKMILDRKLIIIYLNTSEKFLTRIPGYEISNSLLDMHAGRMILRELYWFNKGVPEHETTYEYFSSKEATQAFQDGLAGR